MVHPPNEPLPCLLDHLEDLERRLAERPPALFLDYDGTLTPIVARPELAIMDEAMRAAVRRAGALCTVAIVSGRDRRDVEKLVGLDEVIYAGSHGFDIRGPGGPAIEHEVGSESIPELDEVEHDLDRALAGIEGAQIERKRFSIAVHDRNVPDADVPRVEEAVDRTLASRTGLRKTHGKRVFEVQPDVQWDKGRAVLWLLETLGLAEDAVLPVYIGDDLTDEDAFEALRGRGLGIVVAPGGRPSAAQYRVADVGEVRRILEWIAEWLAG